MRQTDSCKTNMMRLRLCILLGNKRKRGTVQGFFYVKSRIPVANAIILSDRGKTYKDSLLMAAPHSNRTYKGISTGSRCFWFFFSQRHHKKQDTGAGSRQRVIRHMWDRFVSWGGFVIFRGKKHERRVKDIKKSVEPRDGPMEGCLPGCVPRATPDRRTHERAPHGPMGALMQTPSSCTKEGPHGRTVHSKRK